MICHILIEAKSSRGWTFKDISRCTSYHINSLQAYFYGKQQVSFERALSILAVLDYGLIIQNNSYQLIDLRK